jgi:signal transduction histidine kinase
LIGIIYLENTLVSHGFNLNRVNILKIFLSQISISLENARLFANASKTAELYARAKKIKQLNTKLQRTLIELKRSNCELEEFAYVASHDLKAPWRVIDNAATWLEEDLKLSLSDETQKNMDLLHGRVHRMEKLLDDLLEYSRIGRVQDNRFAEIVTGNVLMSDILILLSPSKAFTITTSSNFADIQVKRMPLQQILMNLISNAIKHHDKAEGHIEVTVKDHDAYYTFAVKDDGPGIAPQYHQQIFKMFQTLKPKDQIEGSGMGLAMVRKNIEVFGGTLKLKSSEGKGSTFSFTWPKKHTKRMMRNEI